MYFNTSHVTVYLLFFQKRYQHIKFQYISCYCLSASDRCHCTIFEISIHLMLLFILVQLPVVLSLTNFNTSHVTVYRNGTYYSIPKLRFQYISCYCLSRVYDWSIPITILFQYISCYCLSISCSLSVFTAFHFNTSHVTVYRC